MTSDTRSSRPEEGEDFDLRQMLGTLLDNKWWIAGITCSLVVVTAAYALLATPIYRADAIVQVEPKAPSIPGLNDLSQSLGMGTAESTTEIALLRSRTVIGTAVQKLGLEVEVKPRRFPVVGGYLARRHEAEEPETLASTVLGMSSYGWGGEDLKIYRLEVPDKLVAKELTLVAGEEGAFTLLDDDGDVLVAGRVGDTLNEHGVLMQVEQLRAVPGARFSVVKQRLQTVVGDLQEALMIGEAGKDSGILKLAYDNADPGLARSFLQEVAQAYVRQNVDRNSAEASAQLEFVNKQLPVIRQQVDAAQKSLSAYQTRANSVDLTLQTKGLLEQEVAVETSIQQLRLERAEMDRKFTKDHPAYQSLMKQIGDLESRKAGFQGQVKQLPEAQQELLRLTRDLQVSNEMYTAMLNQAQQLDVAKAGTVGNVRIVDPSDVDATTPVKPRRGLLVLIGLVLGLALSVGFVILRQFLRRGVEDPAEIEDIGLPVYASIPVSVSQRNDSVRGNFKGDGRMHLLTIREPADLAIEAMRSLRTSLHFARLEAKNNVLLISGASPNAGKTFVSSNLAAVIAQTGQRVLVVDADMRKGTLHRAFGVTQAPGLPDLLVGRAELSDVIRPIEGVDGLDFIPRGNVPPNPSELLMHENFTRFIAGVSGAYDIVIIDTPPILAVTDAAIMAHHAGTSLLVARFGLNQKKELELARRRFEQNGVKLKGAIFNAVEKRAVGYYSYGYYEYKSNAN